MRYPVLTWGIALCLLLGACGSTMPSLRESQVFPEDLAEAPFPPTAQELVKTPEFLVIAGVQSAPDLPEYHRDLALSFIRTILEQIGGIQVLPDYRVEPTLKKRFGGKTLTEPLEAQALAQNLRVRYAALLKLKPFPAPEGEASARVQLQIYQVSNPASMLDQTFEFRASQSTTLWQQLKLPLQMAFPSRGFILETRNRQQWARINLGHEQNLEVGRIFEVARRSLPAGLPPEAIKDKATYNLLGTLRLTEVLERESWGLLEGSNIQHIRKGDLVLSKPSAP